MKKTHNKTSEQRPSLPLAPGSASFILDRTGREILPGDTLKIFHFVGARRKRFFMYKYVESVEKYPSWRDGLDALRISHLDLTGETCLKLRDGKRWLDCEIVQGYGRDSTPFDKRPKRKPNMEVRDAGTLEPDTQRGQHPRSL